MNKLFSRIQVVALCVTTVFSYVSCVNEEYDLSEGIDMDMQLLQNAVLPLGNISTISINELLGDTGESSVFSTDQYGNLSLTFGHDGITHTFSMPHVSMDGEGGLQPKNKQVDFKVKAAYAGMPGNQLAESLNNQFGSEQIYYSEDAQDGKPEGNGLEVDIEVDLDKELPEEVLSIRTIDMNAIMNFRFAVSEGAVMYLEKGFTIDFPSYMVFRSNASDAKYEVVEDHKVVINEDVRLSSESPFVLPLSFVRMRGLESMLVQKSNAEDKVVRYLTSNGKIDVYGNLFMKPSEYGHECIPANPYLNLDVEMNNMVMTSAELIIDMDKQLDDKDVEVGILPEMFTGEGTVVDLYNPTLKFTLDNESPLELNLNAEMSSYKGNKVQDIHIGGTCKYNNHETEDVLIPAESTQVYYFSRQGKHDNNNGKDIKLADLGKVLTELPEKIVIHDVLVKAERKYIHINANQEYNMQMDYDFFSPLAFGKDLNISFSYDIDLGLGGDSVGLDSLVVAMNMLNTIPLDINIKGAVLDSNGNVLKSATSDLNLKLKAGTLDNPVESPVEVVLSTGGAGADMAKLRLVMNATSSEEMQGEQLNTAQGLAINDVCVRLPQGIVLNLTNTEE